jgi:ceramide synthetase
MGYYLDDVVNHNFFRPRSNDFWEMNVHHFLTIGLYGGMILMNAVYPGAVVSFLHGLSDITIAASRIGSHSVYKLPVKVIFILQTALFIFLRNIIIPLYTIACWKGLVYPAELAEFQNGLYILTSMLTVLCVMHVYWSAMFVGMIIRQLKSGQIEDT